jgi:hypothetical protein
MFVAGGGSKSNRPAVMRKNMTRALDEFLSGSTSSSPSPSSPAAAAAAASSGSDVVYIGEDVEHGGYYLVTEGLKKKSPALFHTVSRCFKDFSVFICLQGFVYSLILPFSSSSSSSSSLYPNASRFPARVSDFPPDETGKPLTFPPRAAESSLFHYPRQYICSTAHSERLLQG